MLKKVFIVHHTHMDIGYTDLPGGVLDQHLNYMDQVLALCAENDLLPPNRRFFWTCESAWLVRDYFENRPKENCDNLIEALQKGYIELQAFLSQPLTELYTAREFVNSIDYSVSLGEEYNFPVKAAMLNDIGGYMGRYQTVFNACGVKYLTAGVGAFQVHLPWADLPHLFYHQAKNGEKVLVWNLGIDRNKTPQEMQALMAVYGLGANYLINPFASELLGHANRRVEVDISFQEMNPVSAYHQWNLLLDRLKKEKYPYEEIMLQYGGDNRGPDKNLPELLDKIRLLDMGIEVELTTPTKFFNVMEAKYSQRIPVVKGVLTDPWVVRTNPSPVGLKKFRASQRYFHNALAIASISDFRKEISCYKSEIEDICHLHELYTDHTCGLSEWDWKNNYEEYAGTRAEAYDRYRDSWEYKENYSKAALVKSRNLYRKITNKIAANLTGNGDLVVVFNHKPYPQSLSAELYLGRDAEELRGLVDVESGEHIYLQKIGHNNYLFQTSLIRGMGVGKYTPIFGHLSSSKILTNRRIETPFLIVTISDDGKIISVVDKVNKQEYLDTSCNYKLGDFIYQQLFDITDNADGAGMIPSHHQIFPDIITTYVSPVKTGPVCSIFERNCRVLSSTVKINISVKARVYHTMPRIDLSFRLDKPEISQKESCFVVFPFAGDNGEFEINQAIGKINPERDLISGAMQDLFYCYDAVEYRNSSSKITLLMPDMPVVHLGEIRTAQWRQDFPFHLGKGHVFSQIYHNTINTDCPVWQDILEEFSCSLIFTSKEDKRDWPGEVAEAKYIQSVGLRGVSQSKFEILSHDIRLKSLEPINENKVLGYFENVTDKVVNVEMIMRVPGLASCNIVDLRGNTVGEIMVLDGKMSCEFLPLELKGLAFIFDEIKDYGH